MKSKIYRSILLITILTFSGCATLDPSSYGPGAYVLEGTVHYLQIEGGCWQLVTDDDEHYELVSSAILSNIMNGSNVQLIVRNVEGTASICMVGKLVEVLEIIHQSSL